MASNEISGKVLTVLGPIEPEELGVTITHEHLLLDITCNVMEADEASKRGLRHAPVTMDKRAHTDDLMAYSLDNRRLLDVDAAIEEVSRYRHAGGDSLVDATSITIGRDPLALARISRATGLNVIMGGSYYVPRSYPPDMDQKTEDSIAEEIVRDVTVGVGDSGIRSGIIGEIGNTSPLSENERKVLRASARAQAETGAPIMIHPGWPLETKLEIVQILASAGADPQRCIMGHLDGFNDRDALRNIAETGCYLELDIFGWEDTSFIPRVVQANFVSDIQKLESIEFLIELGYLDRIVVAQDVCWKWQRVRYGGKGYAHVLENIVPRMRERGFSEEQVHAILVDNPRRALTFA